jgi:hypothetical protein
MNKNAMRPYLLRLGIIFALSLAFVIIFNEVTFRLQKDETDRAPKTVQLVIPAGTADRIEAGEQVLDIEEMQFVLGDVLEVVNHDSASHQLGPVWVPPGSTGKLVMEQADKFAYSCSFQTSQYLGLDVRQPTTLGTRLVGISFATPTMTALIFIYSLAAFPIKPEEEPTLGSTVDENA